MGKLNAQPYANNHRPGPGRVNLLLSGFYKQAYVSTDEIVEALEALPASHIEGLQVIRYDPERTIQQMLARSSGQMRIEHHVMGAYYYASDLNGIVLYRFDSALQCYHMLYHELGHYVFMRVIDQSLRDRWLHEVRVQNRLFVSRYASTSAAEDFAECYAFFCVYPHELAKIPAKLRYMAEEVFYLEAGSYEFTAPDVPNRASRMDPDVPPAMPELF